MINKKVFSVVAAALLFTCVQCAGANEIEPLQGLKGLGIQVDELPEAAQKIHLSKDAVQRIVEQKLKMSGIQLLSKEDSVYSEGAPYMRVSVFIGETGSGPIYGNIELSILEGACLQRNKTCSRITTWAGSDTFLLKNKAELSIKDKLKDQMDIFLNDYYTANPRPALPVKKIPVK